MTSEIACKLSRIKAFTVAKLSIQRRCPITFHLSRPRLKSAGNGSTSRRIALERPYHQLSIAYLRSLRKRSRASDRRTASEPFTPMDNKKSHFEPTEGTDSLIFRPTATFTRREDSDFHLCRTVLPMQDARLSSGR
jgi:hypothetical protein